MIAFAVSLLPILISNPLPNLLQFLSRLFPFQRGLIHSYWAPNVWALYAGIDRVLSFIYTRFLHLPVRQSNTANGLVGIVSFSVLPEISSVMTIVLMLTSYMVNSLNSFIDITHSPFSCLFGSNLRERNYFAVFPSLLFCISYLAIMSTKRQSCQRLSCAGRIREE